MIIQVFHMIRSLFRLPRTWPAFDGKSEHSAFYLERFGFRVFFLFFLFTACNKSSKVHENKAFVTITNTSPGSSPIDVISDGSSILGGTILSYNQTTGTPGKPYIQATAGVSQLAVTEGMETVLKGNTAFQQGLYYSLFVYDTLTNDSLKLFILQDNLQTRTDTFTYVRFINFSPGTFLNLLLTNDKDTVGTGFMPYAGNKLNPTDYYYQILRIGSYGVRAFRDTLYANSVPLDSLQIDSTKIYTVFLQGFPDSTGKDSLMLKSIQHN